MLTEIHLQGKIAFCCMNCGKKNEVEAKALELGVDDDPNIVRLPACACGTFLFLNRAWDRAVPVSQSRIAVLALCKHLKDSGRSHKAWKKMHASEPDDPPNTPEMEQFKGKVRVEDLKPHPRDEQ